MVWKRTSTRFLYLADVVGGIVQLDDFQAGHSTTKLTPLPSAAFANPHPLISPLSTTLTRSNGFMIPAPHEQSDFDIAALFSALDAQRLARALSWPGVAKEIWNQSATLNAQRNDHPMSAPTLTGMAKRMDTSCQHALFMLRWLGRTPESFIPGSASNAKSTALPQVGSNRRLRWDLQKLYNSLDTQRRELGLSWPQLAQELRCTPSQLSGIKRARFAISMTLAMRIVVWLDCSARDFVYAANW